MKKLSKLIVIVLVIVLLGGLGYTLLKVYTPYLNDDPVQSLLDKDDDEKLEAITSNPYLDFDEAGNPFNLKDGMLIMYTNRLPDYIDEYGLTDNIRLISMNDQFGLLFEETKRYLPMEYTSVGILETPNYLDTYDLDAVYFLIISEKEEKSYLLDHDGAVIKEFDGVCEAYNEWIVYREGLDAYFDDGVVESSPLMYRFDDSNGQVYDFTHMVKDEAIFGYEHLKNGMYIYIDYDDDFSSYGLMKVQEGDYDVLYPATIEYYEDIIIEEDTVTLLADGNQLTFNYEGELLEEVSLEDESAIKVGLVTDGGSIDDGSFNQYSWKGVDVIGKEYDIEYNYIVPDGMNSTDYLAAIDELVDSGHKLIVAPGFMLETAIYHAQDSYPDTQFILLDGTPHSEDYSEFRTESNVLSLFFAEEDAGFLAGIAAALESKTGKVAFIGGMAIPPVEHYGWGFVSGVAYANETYGTNVHVADYIYQGSFSEVEAGTQIASLMYDDGIDIIFSAAGGVGIGAINEAKERANDGQDVWAIGVDIDQYEDGLIDDGSSIILTSAIKKLDVAAYKYITTYLEDHFPGGLTLELTAKEYAVGLPSVNPNLQATTVDQINEAEIALVDQLIVVPDDLDSLIMFLSEYGYETPSGVEY